MIVSKIIIEKENKPKDIFTKGNLVISHDEKCVILVRSDNRKSFHGQVVYDVDSSRIGQFYYNWNKDFFSQFVGKLQLTSIPQQ